jgi:hypothetical protein
MSCRNYSNGGCQYKHPVPCQGNRADLLCFRSPRVDASVDPIAGRRLPLAPEEKKEKAREYAREYYRRVTKPKREAQKRGTECSSHS